MSKLIEQLQTEHGVLIARLDEVRNSIDRKTGKLPVDKAVFTLTLVKKALLAHLKKEDDKLYPLLERAAATDPAIRGLLRRFSEDMSKISAAALAFFDKYSSGGLFTTAFSVDLERLHSVLMTRIRAEETELYPAYERVEALTPEPSLPAMPRAGVNAPAASASIWLVAMGGAAVYLAWSFLLH